MRLRFREGMPSDEFMGQIQRQLEEESAQEVKYPIEPAHYVALLFDPRDNVLVPFERSSYTLQSTCSKVLLHYRQEQQPYSSPSSSSLQTRCTAISGDSEGISSKECALMKMEDVESNNVGAAARTIERERIDKSTATMLHIVGLLISELSFKCKSDCELTERSWPAMMTLALDKEHTKLEELDPTIVDQFKKTILSSISRGQKIRGLE